jgi:uncharacterized protein YndB with AHSA1/START domain
MNEMHHEVWINAPRAVVYEAITSRDGLDAWWGPVTDAGVHVGEEVRFDHGLGDLLRMRIADLGPGERVVWECVSEFTDPANPASEWRGTTLSFELTDGGPTGFEPIDSHLSGPVTILNFRQTGWPDQSRWCGFCNYGWGVTLEGLANHCEGAQ